ncbi:type 2 isopentenyl-diphosphate Delta-isomerase [Loigolactobacillus jiayinensis]|uniref:Isopentenyl-diphosphate delta-isomerase n=1 Tax=Loigolactobacillus jiayinensis TaxID=2486016 RepID=A0ABW1R892_9LACO|nr:type 2 isopentenyl-diphosphate Delta-isomerase [Loigolactobacillus jiayinensis]
MAKLSAHAHRKDEHVFLAEKFYTPTITNDFDQVRLLHQSLPEIALSEIDLTTTLAGQPVAVPFYINAMTGGSPCTQQLNQQLATIAANLAIPMATGSQSVALKEPELAASFKIVRDVNPKGVILANLGADATLAQAEQAVAMLHANALQVHLNTPQEVVMPEGEQRFYWLANLSQLVTKLSVPVIVKEVGFGMSQTTLAQLSQAGSQYVDLGGRGGTNFVQIENARRPQRDLAYLAGWGQSTVESLLESRAYQQQLTIYASGGVRQPLDIVKALALGAKSVGVAGTILHHLQKNGLDATQAWLAEWLTQLKLIFALLGCRNVSELPQKAQLIFSPELVNYAAQRQIKL